MAKADKQLQDDFPFYKDEKTALFIDGANLYAATKALDFEIDYRKLLSYFRPCTLLILLGFYYLFQ